MRDTIVATIGIKNKFYCTAAMRTYLIAPCKDQTIVFHAIQYVHSMLVGMIRVS